MTCPNLMIILVDHRTDDAVKVQDVLTKHGCSIKTRLGLHESCEETGLIILQLCGDEADIVKLEHELKAIHNLSVERVTMKLPERLQACTFDCGPQA